MKPAMVRPSAIVLNEKDQMFVKEMRRKSQPQIKESPAGMVLYDLNQ